MARNYVKASSAGALAPFARGRSEGEMAAGRDEIVDPQTDKVNTIPWMLHFPHLSMQDVTDRWQQFKSHDLDESYMLDVSGVRISTSSS